MIDFDKLQTLDSPRRKLHDPFDRERLAEIKARRIKHKPSKAHATNKERCFLLKARAARIRKYREEKEKARKIYLALVRAYWAGEIDFHP